MRVIYACDIGTTRPARKGRRRDGEKDGAFSAPAGLAVTALAVHEAAWILAALRRTCKAECIFTTDWKAWPPSGGQQLLFCWEAFVSGKAHSDTQVYDAATAATCFSLNESNLDQANAVTSERPLSLIGTAALWSGWTNDLAIPHNPHARNHAGRTLQWATCANVNCNVALVLRLSAAIRFPRESPPQSSFSAQVRLHQ